MFTNLIWPISLFWGNFSFEHVIRQWIITIWDYYVGAMRVFVYLFINHVTLPFCVFAEQLWYTY